MNDHLWRRNAFLRVKTERLVQPGFSLFTVRNPARDTTRAVFPRDISTKTTRLSLLSKSMLPSIPISTMSPVLSASRFKRDLQLIRVMVMRPLVCTLAPSLPLSPGFARLSRLIRRRVTQVRFTCMPTNVTPEYKKAEEAYRKAREPRERLATDSSSVPSGGIYTTL